MSPDADITAAGRREADPRNVDGSESFLVPHVTRTALNSLAFQKRLFGYDPHQDLTLLLMDLADIGNAAASSVPHDLVRVQIAPLGFAFETIAANERINTSLNQEMVLVATMDQTAARTVRSGICSAGRSAACRAAGIDPVLLPAIPTRRGAALPDPDLYRGGGRWRGQCHQGIRRRHASTRRPRGFRGAGARVAGRPASASPADEAGAKNRLFTDLSTAI
jgi:hypothetical protein